MELTSASAADFAVDPERIEFMGLTFDPLDTEGAVVELVRRADRGCDFTYLVTPNVDHMVRLDAEPDLRPLYTDAGMLVCDSRILELFAKFESKELPAAPGADIVEALIRDHERFAFLCVGSPQQEMVAREALRLGRGKGVALCCGASLEFLAGRVERAPLWMRNARLEWLHRLLSEPKRMWKRYLVDGPRIFAIWRKHKSEQ